MGDKDQKMPTPEIFDSFLTVANSVLYFLEGSAEFLKRFRCVFSLINVTFKSQS